MPLEKNIHFFGKNKWHVGIESTVLEYRITIMKDADIAFWEHKHSQLLYKRIG
jgi:hypothetical protein